MSASSTTPRTPLMISAGDLVVGPIHAVFRDGDQESLLHNYLVLIRQLRGEQRQQRLTLRGADISALAVHLGTSEETVLGDLLDLMGATRAQRTALLTLFAAGALTIVATGSIALNLLPTGASAERAHATTAVVSAEDPEPSTVTDALLVTEVDVSPVTSVTSMTADHPAIESVVSVDARPTAEALAPSAAAPAQLVSPPRPGSPAAPAVEITAGPVEGVGVADDGSTVAVGPPPVVSIEGVGIADDGSNVAVAPPPIAPD